MNINTVKITASAESFYPGLDDQRFMTHVPHGVYKGAKFRNPQPLPLDANTANWDSVDDHSLLGSIGIHYLHAQWHKTKRALEQAHERRVAAAYRATFTDREAVYRDIVRQLQTDPNVDLGGIWPPATASTTVGATLRIARSSRRL